jgi:hypothetical protein
MTRNPASQHLVAQVISAQEFLHLRQRITHDDVVLAQFDDQLRHMCTTHPDDAVRVLATLTHSHQYHDREAAAIYLGHLLRTRREPASRLLRELLGDPDDHIRDTATDTVTAAIHTGTLDPIGAARLYDR